MSKCFDKSLFFLVISALLICGQACNHVLDPKPFPQEYTLSSERVSLKEGVPRSMEIKNGFLLMLMKDYIYCYSIFDHSISYRSRSQINAQWYQFLGSSSPHLYFMDVNNKNEIRKYGIDALGQTVLLQTGHAGMNTTVNRPYILHDSLIVYDEFIPEAAVKIRNLYTNAVTRTLPYGSTSLEDRFYDPNMGGLYANDSCIAFAYKYQDKIDFYDWQFNLIQSVNHQQSEPVIYKEESKYLDNVHYYGYSYMGRNYFYTLYRGVRNKVFYADSLQIYKTLYDYGMSCEVLEVYDLDGRAVCRFRFADMTPSAFVVDEEQNILLGQRLAYPDSLLLYHLQGLPKNGSKYPDTEKNSCLSFPQLPPPEAPKEVVYYERYRSYDRRDYPTYWVYGEFYMINGLSRAPEAQGAVTVAVQ